MPSIKLSAKLLAFLVIWLASTTLGFVLLEIHHNRPGDPGRPVEWPRDCPIRLDAAKPTLVLFVHPRCPCSRASTAELASIRSDLLSRFVPHIVVYQPRVRSDEWERSASSLDGVALPGWRRWDDVGGELAREFGVRTSGHVLVFDPRGRLLSSGGVTPGRGERGQGGRLEALLAGIEDRTIKSWRGPVFGCSMGDSDTAIVAKGMQ